MSALLTFSFNNFTPSYWHNTHGQGILAMTIITDTENSLHCEDYVKPNKSFCTLICMTEPYLEVSGLS